MVVVDTTKIYSNNQTVIPKYIMEEFGLTPDVKIDWHIDEDKMLN